MSIHENLMLVQQMKKSTLYLLILSIFGCITCNNYDIKSCLNLIFVQTNRFSDQPGNPMPNYTISNFFTNCYTKSILARVIFKKIDYQILVGIGFSMVIYI